MRSDFQIEPYFEISWLEIGLTLALIVAVIAAYRFLRKRKRQIFRNLGKDR